MHAHEDVLHQVLGVGPAPEQAPAQAQDEPRVPADNLLECMRVSARRGAHQVRVFARGACGGNDPRGGQGFPAGRRAAVGQGAPTAGSVRAVVVGVISGRPDDVTATTR